MPLVYIPDSIEPTLASAGTADYLAYPRERAYLYDEPRFDQPRYRDSYPDSYLPLNPYSRSCRQLLPHPDPYARVHPHPHGARHMSHPHALPRSHSAYPYDSFQEYERPSAPVDRYGPSAYHDTIRAARRQAEYEAEAMAAARAELAAEKLLKERAKAERLAKAKRAAAIEAYLAREAALKEEKERQKRVERERMRYEAAVAAAKEKIKREEEERAILEARNRQRQRSLQQAPHSAGHERSLQFHDQSISEPEHDPIQSFLELIGLSQPQPQLQARHQSQPQSNPSSRVGCQALCQAGPSSCQRQQSNDFKKHEGDLLTRLMSLQEKPACVAPKREEAKSAQPDLTNAQPAKSVESEAQHQASKQVEIDPLQFLLQLVEAASRKKDEPTSTASPSKPESSTEAPAAPVWHWIPHPSAQTPPTATVPESKPKTDSSSSSTAARKVDTVNSPTPVEPVSSSPEPSPSHSPSSRLRLSKLNNQFSSLIDRPTDKALGRSELEHELTRLLLEADEIESDGDETLRGDRKQFVVRVERVLDSLDVDRKQSQPQSQTVETEAEEEIKESHDDEAVKEHTNATDLDSSAPATIPSNDSTPEHTPATGTSEDTVESTATENQTTPLPEDDLSTQPETHTEVKVDSSAEETPAAASPAKVGSTTSPSESATALPSASVAAAGDVDAAVSDASSEASSRPSSPVVASSSAAQRRDSSGSTSSSSSSIRRGRKAYVEDAVEDEDDDFHLI